MKKTSFRIKYNCLENCCARIVNDVFLQCVNIFMSVILLGNGLLESLNLQLKRSLEYLTLCLSLESLESVCTFLVLHMQGIVSILLEDNLKQELSMAYRNSIQEEVARQG